jgi:hypothetical protein
MHFLPASLTPVTSCITGVVDTGQYRSPTLLLSMTPAKNVFAGVVDTGDARIAGVIEPVMHQ